MDGLPRSETSFRRQGSSGLIWDDKLLSGELKRIKTKPKQEEEDHGKPESRERPPTYRAIKVEPTIDPPSPKVSGCGLCGCCCLVRINNISGHMQLQ
ncbi:uncharacterized protein At1g15400-like [Cornus florida]|uniref:uncharacterized protein At1g15400-like n=1 Tax=Cornus florida TaxID=4283 RepID=UPI00289F33D0|nr:uncharacterized protein At1g15400-like [Cornus florida]